jgi:hypothetical protein
MHGMLPQPLDGFRWVRAPGGTGLLCRSLARVASHIFTTREWPLGSTKAATPDDSHWADVAHAMNVEPPGLIRVRQVHGAAVFVRRSGDSMAGLKTGAPAVETEADIVVSDNLALALAVQTADCVPLLVADRRTGAVAAAHAGWRGTAARVAIAATGALAREFGSRPADLVAAVGPSIGACCYEVGDEVRERFEREGFLAEELTRWFLRHTRQTPRNPSMPGVSAVARAGHWYFDLWRATREQLEAAGVPAGQIHLAGLCTASHRAALCSYRRDGSGAGRLAAVIRGRGPAAGNPRIRIRTPE